MRRKGLKPFNFERERMILAFRSLYTRRGSGLLVLAVEREREDDDKVQRRGRRWRDVAIRSIGDELYVSRLRK